MIQFDEKYPEAAGLIPQFLSTSDPRPARTQLNDNYAHGGGWNSFAGFELIFDPVESRSSYLLYPEDPPMRVKAIGRLRDELVLVFDYDWVCIRQPDGTYEIARMD